MKIISNKLTASIAALAAALLLAGCSNILEKDSPSSDGEKGRLIFSASARAVNTVVPSGFDFSKDTGLTFTLTGTISGGKSATLGSWSDSADSLAYALMAADSSVLVDTGSWTFRLSVAKDGGEVLYGTKTLQVVAGGNLLDFGALSEASADDETRDSSIDVAKGSVSVTLSFPAGKAVSAESLFYSEDSDDGSKAGAAALEVSAGEESDSVVFTKKADRGTYILEIRVYTDEAKEQGTSYTALVVVAPGLESTAQASLSSLNAQYTVTYNLNGGSFAEGTTVRTSYSPADVFTLPEPEKDYYEFTGWAKSAVVEPVETTVAADYAAGDSISVDGDTALYALWTFSSDKLADYISSLTEDTTVVIRGALANSDLAAINTAIKSGSYKIALDLSETTGLTEIADKQFQYNTNLSGIVIPDSVTSIGNNAFIGCTGLTSVEIGDGVTSIGSYAFRDCTGLTSITLGDNVTSIGGGVFLNCTGLISITIPDSVTSIGSSAFYGCTGLTEVTIPGSVTSIGSAAFADCTRLTSVDIGGGVTSIGSSAFYKCTSLTSITIPDSVTSIGDRAFQNCKNLSIVYITDLAAWCNISFGNNYSSNPLCYEGTLYLNGEELSGELVIPDGVTKIPIRAFYNCTGLTSVTIPGSVTSIGSYAFGNCTGLTSVEIGDSVTSIGYGAFSDCTGLTSVTIPDDVTSIGYSAFSGCAGLTSVTIPDSVTSIGNHAFSGCTGLTSVDIGDGVTSIGSSAFYGCTSLTSVIIPGSVTSIGDSAFQNCKNLASVYITDLEAWCNISFGNDYSNPLYYGGTLYLNGEALSESIVIPDGVTEIPDYTFKNCTGLTSITIPDSVTSIGNGAFRGCTGLTSITIPDSVTSIGSSAFNGCTGLTSVDIGEGVTSIGNAAFSDCTGLTSMIIGNSVISIGNSTFHNCKGIASITIPDSVTTIGSRAFYECSGLTTVEIGDSVTSIGSWAFQECTSLKEVIIPDSVTNIGYRAFRGCTSLASVTIGSGVEKIGQYAFSNCSALTSATFKDTAGWYYTTSSSYTGGTALSSTDLADTSTAATYLKSTYYSYWWYKE